MTALFLVVTVVLTALAYTSVGVFVFDHRSPVALLAWLSSYAGADLPQWGAWSFHRLPPLLDSAVSSVAPLTPFGGVTGLLRRGSTPGLLLPWAALAAILAQAVITGWAVLGGPGRGSRLATLVVPALGYASFLPFLFWWDPFEPKWFVVPNLFLAALLARAWAAAPRPRATLAAVTCAVTVVAVATFSIRIWPASSGPSIEQRRADCLASHLQAGDLFYALDWKWIAHLKYFHQLRVASVIGLSARLGDPDRLLSNLEQQLQVARRRGRRAFVVDPASYPPGYLRWLESQTGLGREHLRRWRTSPAFECEGVPVREVEGFRGPPPAE